MEKELENKLFKNYPKLFRQKDLSMQETCMCWGICTSDGWYWLINNLCSCIQNYTETNDKSQVEVVQVKEKFGGLRFYVDSADAHIRGMIWLAEDMSYKICENCGATDGIVHTGGLWMKTLCKKCYKRTVD